MQAIPNIITERVDDLPLWIDQMQRMGLPTLWDTHCPTHGNWTGRSVGGVRTIWLSSMWSRGDHRRVPVAPWRAQRLWTRGGTTGPAVTRVDCTADRRALVRRRLRADTRWAACAAALHQDTGRGDARSTARVHVDRTSARVYATVSAGGLCQCGPSQDERPALPQGKVRPAVLDPLGMPLATAGGAGARADAPRSRPCMERGPARVGRPGLWAVGDGKRAARDTRARIAAAGDVSLCPRPQGQRDAGEGDAALAAVRHGAPVRSSVVREGPQGQPAVSAAGDAYPVAMRLKGEGQGERWTARRLVGRSVRQAPAAAAALGARVAKAMAQMEARNQRGRGPKRVETVSAFRQAVVAMGPRDSVEDLRGLRLTQPNRPRPVRASRGQPARGASDRHATVAVRVDAAAWEATMRRWGGRVDGPHQPVASWSLAQAVRAYRRAYPVERRCGRRKGRPLSLTPLSVQRDDQATGRMRWLSIALRVLTRLACVGRRPWATAGGKLAGLDAGHPPRATDRPTAERLLEALQDITLTIIQGPHQTDRPRTALSPLHQRMLEVLGFSSALYTRRCTISSEPP